MKIYHATRFWQFHYLLKTRQNNSWNQILIEYLSILYTVLSNQLAIWTLVRNWCKKQLFLLFQITNGQSIHRLNLVQSTYFIPFFPTSFLRWIKFLSGVLHLYSYWEFVFDHPIWRSGEGQKKF